MATAAILDFQVMCGICALCQIWFKYMLYPVVTEIDALILQTFI